MWIMLDKGFISMVQHKDDPDLMLVRARVGADLANVFGDDIDIVEDPSADYLYRAVVTRQRVAETLRDAVLARTAPSTAKTSPWSAPPPTSTGTTPTTARGRRWLGCSPPGPTAATGSWGRRPARCPRIEGRVAVPPRPSHAFDLRPPARPDR